MKKIEIENFSIQELNQMLKRSVNQIIKELREDGLEPVQEKFLTMPEVIPLLDMKKTFIQKKCRDGIIPHYKRGTKYFFLYSELSDWIQEGKIKTIAEESAELKTRIKKRL